MKLVCPKCHLKMGIARERIPAHGAWAGCPACKERFFVKPSGQPFMPNFTAKTTAQGPQVHKPGGFVKGGSESQQLLDRIKRRKVDRQHADDEADLDLNTITVFPDSSDKSKIGPALSVVFLVLPLLFISYGFSLLKSQPNRRSEQPMAAIERMQDDSNIEVVRNDLINLKRNLMRRQRVNIVEIGYSGPESRIFKYFRNELLPEVCAEGISHIAISSPEPCEGFTATATCLGRGPDSLTMNVQWPGRSAIVDFINHPGQGPAELEMFSLAAQSSRPR